VTDGDLTGENQVGLIRGFKTLQDVLIFLVCPVDTVATDFIMADPVSWTAPVFEVEVIAYGLHELKMSRVSARHAQTSPDRACGNRWVYKSSFVPTASKFADDFGG
jgi:hypothetical protein